MTPSNFADRLAYARVVYHIDHGKAPGNAEIGKAVGRTGPTVTGWMVREEAPPFHDIRAPLAAYLNVSESWLFDGAGEPPRPELWRDWIVQRRTHRPASKGTATHRVAKPAAADAGKGGKRRAL